jgi:hypothetical protein
MRITFVPGIPPGANVNICIGGRYKCYFLEGQGGSVPTLIMIKGSWGGQKPVQLSVEQGGLHRVCTSVLYMGDKARHQASATTPSSLGSR